MPIYAKDSSQDFEKIPTGLQNASCCGVVDMGMVPGFQGELTHKVALVFELEERRKEGECAGQRFVVAKNYTLSLHEKANLSKDLESWRGRAFTVEERKGLDLEKLIATPCTLNMIETSNKAGKALVVIGGIRPHMKNAERLVPENPPDFIPKWIKKQMAGAGGEQPPAEIHNDDIPF
jgi:hypothetical protein